MDFGLGLVLSFTDNATGGIQNAVNTLNQLTETASNASNSLTGMAQLGAFSVVADRMGSSFIKMGSGMISTLGAVIGKVNETGQTLMFAENQLGKLYEGTDKSGKDVLNNISEYAKKSIFDFENLIPVVTMLKANGIEAFDEITSSTGKSKQMLMDYAADLAAFNPQMRNAYGTGIQAAMGALNEYIAEGNAVSLKRGASLDITALLGEDKGKTIEERSRQVADLMEKLNMVGMTAQLAESPMTKISNMGDTLFQFLGMISDSGVYDKFNEIITIFADFVNGIPNEDLKAIADSVGSALSSLLEPVKWLAEKLVTLADAFKDLVANNPALAQFVIKGFALTGVLLLVSGVALKVMSSLGFLTIGLRSFGGSFSAVTSLLKTGVLKMLGALLPFTLTIGLMYITWKNDLGGIRTLLTNFVANIQSSFSEARRAADLNVNGMMGVVGQLESKGDFWSNFTIGIIKVKTLAEALSDAWSDYTLSEDVYLKCKELGILPLVEAILDLKWRLEHFWAGFKEGVANVVAFFVGGFKKVAGALKGTFIGDALDSLTKFFQFLTNNDPEAWKKFGTVIGELAAVIIPFVLALKLFSKVSSVGSIFPRIIGGIFSLFGGRGGSGGNGGGSGSGGLLSNPGKVLKTFASLAIIIGGAVLVIEAIGALSKVPYFMEFLSSGTSTMKKLASSMLSVVVVGGAMGLLTALLSGLSISPATALKGIADLAILIGGLDILIIALGALNSIPHFAEFLSSGAIVMSQLFNVLGNMFDLKAIAVIGLISAFGLVPIPVVLTGLANLALVLGGLTILIEAFGALSKIPYFNEFLQSGGDTLALLFEQIGKVAGSLVGGFAEGVTASLPEIGNNIAQFGENIRPFFDAISGADLSGVADFASAIGTLALKLTANEFLSFFTGSTDYVGLAEQLTEFGEKLKPFFDSVANYSEEGLKKSPQVFEALQGMGDYDFKTGGLAQLFTGETNLSTIGSQLADFAPNGETFFNAVAGYSEEGLEKAPKVFEALKGIGDYDFKTGGLAQLFTGETSISVIGEQLADFSENGATFFNAVAGYSEEGLRKAPLVFSALAGIGDYDFKTGGLAQLFTGSTDLGEIGEQLSDFIGEAKDFFNGVSDIPLTSFTKANSLFSTLNEINQSGFSFDNLDDLGDVGSELTVFGNNVQGFFTVIADIPMSSFSNARSLFSALSSMDTVMNIASSSNGSLRSFGNELTDFADSMQTFLTKIGQMNDMSGLNTFTEGLQTLSNKFMEVEGGISTGSQSIVSSLDNVISKSGDMSSSFSSDMDTMFNKQSTTFSQMATVTDTTFTQMATKISTTMQSAVSSVQTAVGTMKSAMNFSWSLPHLKVPHVNVSGSFNLDPPSAPNFSVDWYAKGGVFNQPSIIGVGEQGKEAVMPLENNTGWINDLAFMISQQIMSVTERQFTPSDGYVTATNNTSEDKYMTSSVVNNTRSGSTDNSVTFEQGAIQINCQNATEEEALKMAKTIMEYIKRQQQLDKMLAYG